MWLRYGVDTDNSLVAIEDVPSGKTHLKCPYCGQKLIAKKGRLKEPHFAHFEETCRSVASRGNREIPVLPLYNNFSLQLSGKEFEQLKTLWSQYGARNDSIPRELVPVRFIYLGLLRENEYLGSYKFTKLGKIPFGQLSLMLFNQVQEPLILAMMTELQGKTERAFLAKLSSCAEWLIDLQIYRTQLKKILSTTLYYLKIQADDQILHKIGVTQRPIEERVIEVQGDLRSHFHSIKIKVLGIWPHRGNVEKYFKHRYQDWNHRIGSLTEYYKFDSVEVVEAVLRDLEQMQPKVLSEIEQEILAGKLSQIEQIIQAEHKAICSSRMISS